MRVDSEEFRRTFGNGVAATDGSDAPVKRSAAQEALWEMLVRRCSCFRLAWSICVASVNLGGNTPAARWILLTQRLSGLPSEKVFAKIFTVDQRDFAVYKIHGRIRPSIIP
jgi:hypothetical protein